MHPNSRGLAFLLSIGSLPLACGKSEDGDADSSSTNPTTQDTGTGGTTTTGGTDGGTEPQPTTSTGSSTATGDTDGPPPGADPACIAFGQHYVECYPRAQMYENNAVFYCQDAKDYGLQLDGQACADAFDAYYVCMSMVECADFGSEEACNQQRALIEEACPLSEGTADTSSDSSGG